MAGLEKRIVIRQFSHLTRSSFSQFFPAITDVDAPEPRHPVEILLAIAVSQRRALRPRYDPGALCIQVVAVSKRMQVVGGIERLQFGSWRVIGQNIHRCRSPDFALL